jgi:hypothetical protein
MTTWHPPSAKVGINFADKRRSAYLARGLRPRRPAILGELSPSGLVFQVTSGAFTASEVFSYKRRNFKIIVSIP